MIATEEALEQRALLGTLTGNRSGVSYDKVAAILASKFMLAPADFSVHRRLLEDFLIGFSRPEVHTSVALENVRSPRFCLLIHPWSCSAVSNPSIFASR